MEFENINTLKCDSCDFVTETKEYLGGHQTNIHLETVKRYKCQLSDYLSHYSLLIYSRTKREYTAKCLEYNHNEEKEEDPIVGTGCHEMSQADNEITTGRQERGVEG